MKKINQKLNIVINKIKNLSKYDKRTYIWTGFFVFGFILVLNIVIMTLFLIDSKFEYKILDEVYVDAVQPGQELNDKLTLGIVKIKEVNFQNLEIGDKIVVWGDFSLDVYWIETVVSVDDVSLDVDATYDNLLSTNFIDSDIIGIYIEDANFLGSVYYSASFFQGYIFLSISHLLILFGYYYIFLSRKDHLR